MPPKIRTAAGAKQARRNEKKTMAHTYGHAKSTFNNTVSVTDTGGATISWSSTGKVSFEGSRMPALQASTGVSRGEG